ncbi:MAG TPA: hypothetical protein VMD75_08590, partial [Candidatus Binataceae bacterium]|nr:hypothetical protein [Candidatus Binataceae bacterium]
MVLAAALTATSGCHALVEHFNPPPPPPTIGALRLIPENLDYGRQKLNTATRTHLFILTNPPTNDGPAVISDAGTSGAPFLIDRSVSNCAGVTLPVGGHCEIGVNFAPTTPGIQTGTMAINDNAANSPQIATLQGIG